MRARPSPLRDSLGRKGAAAVVTTWRRGQEILARSDPAERWHVVISGVARKCLVTRNGRRRIVDFLTPGDLFGVTARERHGFAVEAVVDGTAIASYSRCRAELLADDDPELGRLIRQMAFSAISRLQTRILILGQLTALEKVSAFLVEMGERLSDGHTEVITLPMSRYDIADYLAMSVETVSRCLTDLRASGVITVAHRRRVEIVDREALENL